MRTHINRLELLQSLEAVEMGLVSGIKSDTVEQCQCLCFKNGKVYTFDGEVFGRTQTPLPKEWTAAVQGKALLETLRALTVDDLEVEIKDGEFIVASKRDEVGIPMTPKIILPYHEVPIPKIYRPLPQDFCEALQMVSECVGRDNEMFLFTCIHLNPKFMEALDNFSFARWRMKLPIEQPILIRGKQAKLLARRGPTKVGIAPSKEGASDGWLYFRNGTGLSIALPYFDPAEHDGELLTALNESVKDRGTAIAFPKRLASAAKLAEIFSKENADNNTIDVHLKPGFVRLIGQGVSARTLHKAKVTYSGPKLSFSVGPATFAKLVERHPEIELKSDRLIATGGRWYWTTLTKELNGEKKEEGS